MNSFNYIGSYLKNVGFSIINYIYNFPALDPSLVLYYPLDTSLNTRVANYASQLPVYDASLSTGTTITTSQNLFVTGLGDLSLNNTMGSTATQYVTSNTSFNLVPSNGLSISCWFSCSGELGKKGTLISLYQNSDYPSIELDIVGSTLFSQYYTPYIYAVPTTIDAIMDSNKFDPSQLGNNYATGYHVYKFTSTGSNSIQFKTVESNISLTVILVAGGGGGGGACPGEGCGGGGGGGVRYGTITINTVCTLTITVGSGGLGGKGPSSSLTASTNGGDSSITCASPVINEIAKGGGRGGQPYANSPGNIGGDGGSGGGGSAFAQNSQYANGGDVTTGTGNLAYYGYKGGKGNWSSYEPPNNGGGGGGGGGASSAGGEGQTSDGQPGGSGIAFNIYNSTTYFAGGGGGGGSIVARNGNRTGGIKGIGGGGNGGAYNTSGDIGSVNTGGGGGGAGGNVNYSTDGGNGGSGICIILVPISQVS